MASFNTIIISVFNNIRNFIFKFIIFFRIFFIITKIIMNFTQFFTNIIRKIFNFIAAFNNNCISNLKRINKIIFFQIFKTNFYIKNHSSFNNFFIFIINHQFFIIKFQSNSISEIISQIFN